MFVKLKAWNGKDKRNKWNGTENINNVEWTIIIRDAATLGNHFTPRKYITLFCTPAKMSPFF